ncbi:hypothetical protein NPIL_366091 [Nephila pilipes]|uniref:Uncharacterized protein n=1 Tax=Nephila pilipes TaxID=299642 RepID=A0A8X6T8T0_NEPPI|nr:hypothetical protein NPIL_366091 [Nephila pilipes]
MTSVYLPLCLFIVFALGSLICDAKFGMLKKTQQISLFKPTEDEKEVCETLAEENKLILKNVIKMKGKICQVVCKFRDGSTLLQYSPKGMICNDMAGNLPTGMCDGHGNCNLMGS